MPPRVPNGSPRGVVLRGVAGCQVGGFGRRLPVADRRARDARRRRGGTTPAASARSSANPAMLSKPGRIVRRQERRDVDLQVQQVADGVRVSRPIQAVQHHDAGSTSAWPQPIDLRLRASRAVLRTRPAAAGARRGAASRPAPASARLSPRPRRGAAHARRSDPFQREVGGLDAVVMAGDTDPDRRASFVDRWSQARARPRRSRGGHCGRRPAGGRLPVRRGRPPPRPSGRQGPRAQARSILGTTWTTTSSTAPAHSARHHTYGTARRPNAEKRGSVAQRARAFKPDTGYSNSE